MGLIKRLVLLALLWKAAMCADMILNLRGDETGTDYYAPIVIKENISESLMNNIFIGPSASFSIKYSGNFVASTINFSQARNGTFFKCWHQANISSVTCELQTMNQCKSTLVNKSCCSYRNAFLWNTTSEFLFSTELKNTSLNFCDNENHRHKYFFYEMLNTLSTSTTPHMTSTLSPREEDHSGSTGLIVGIVVAVILVVVLAIVCFLIWNSRKKQKMSKNNAFSNEARFDNSQTNRQTNVPNLYHNITSANATPVNVKNKLPSSSLTNGDIKDQQTTNTKPNYTNDSAPQTSEGNYFVIDYDIPKSQNSTIDDNVDKLEYYSTNNDVQQLIDDYSVIDSPCLQTAVDTPMDGSPDAEIDYSTIADTVGEAANIQSDKIIANELNVKNPYSVMGSNQKIITNPYDVLPSEPMASSGYFVLLSEGELAPYSLAKNENPGQ